MLIIMKNETTNMSVIRTRIKEYYIMEHYSDEERVKHVNKMIL